MRRSVLRAASVLFAVGVLGTVVVHAALSAGCKSEGSIAQEPQSLGNAAPPSQPNPPPPSKPVAAETTAGAVGTVNPPAKTAAKPTSKAPRYMPATKAAPVFVQDDMQNEPPPPPQQAPQPAQQSNAGKR